MNTNQSLFSDAAKDVILQYNTIRDNMYVKTAIEININDSISFFFKQNNITIASIKNLLILTSNEIDENYLYNAYIWYFDGIKYIFSQKISIEAFEYVCKLV